MASHHLKLLRARKLVTFEKDGRLSFYFIDGEPARTLLEEAFAVLAADKDTFHLGNFSLTRKKK